MTKENDAPKIPGYVTTAEAAEMLGLSYYRMYEYIDAGRIPAIRVGHMFMIPIEEVQKFKPRPTGRLRHNPPPWRIYRAGAKVHCLEIQVQVRPGKQQSLTGKLQTMLEQQQHLFPGTMQRYIFEDESDPAQVTIVLIWKDTEMADEAAMERDLAALKDALGDVLDWETARYSRKRAIMHT